MTTSIHIINGPNLNLVGKREKDLYGTVPFSDYFTELVKVYHDQQLHYFQSNHEGQILDYLHQYGFEKDCGIVINAGGLTHTSIVLRDAIAAIDAAAVEIHISNIYKREEFRRTSFLTEVCVATFVGYGLDGYRRGIDYLLSGK